MLSPNYLQYVADELVDDFAQLESDILCDIARRIKENNYSDTSTANFQKEQLQALGMSNTEIQRRLSEILKISKSKVSEILSRSVYESIANDNQIINEAYKEGIVSSFSFERGFLKDIILNGIQNLNVELRNICNTTATTSENILYQAMNKAYLQIQSGAFTSDVAIDNVIRDLSKQGISMVDYESGAHRRLDSAVRNAVRTSVNKTACKAQEKNLDEQGVNLVETTSHWGARPSHAEWQGKVFYRKKKVKGYKNFYDATGYGKGSGLGGWNCRHSYYPFYEGLSEQSFEHLNEKENEEYYNLTQQQRYNERMVREWKRRRDVCKAGGVDAYREAHKLREWNARNKKLLKDYPQLKSNFAREKAYTNLSDYITFEEKGILNRYLSSFSYKINEKLRNDMTLSNGDRMFIENLNNILSKVDKFVGTVTRDLHFMFKEDYIAFIKTHKIGEKVTYNEFISTTKLKSYNESAHARLFITSKNGRDISKYNKDEEEVLFKTNSSFEVLKIDKKNDIICIYMKEV